MKHQRVLMVVMILGVLTLAPHLARAQASCWGYLDVQSHCSGSGGCSSPYFYSLCTTGCVHGLCVGHGSSGQCCGHVYYSAVIYSDGDDCPGDECGLLRAHAPSSAKSSKRLNPQPVRQATAENLGLASEPPILGLPASRLLFVPDRCTHTYHIVLQRDLPVDFGGI